MKKGRKLIIVFLLSAFILSCSASNIARRGEYIDPKSIAVGTPRNSILVRFGPPVDMTVENGAKIDVYRIIQGEKTASKIIKGTGTILLGVATLGLSEIIADPVTEGKPKKYVGFEIHYDANDRVQTVNFLE